MNGNFTFHNPTKLHFGENAMNITELGATEEMIPKIADATFLLDGGYKQLTRDEVISILRESL